MSKVSSRCFDIRLSILHLSINLILVFVNTIKLILIAIGCLIMVACTKASKRFDYVADYSSSLQSAQENPSDLEYPDELENLITLFSDLKSKQLRQLVIDTYSSEFYFNDTLHTFTDRDELTEYLIDGAQRVDEISISFDDVAISGQDHYVRWVMQMKFKVMGKSIDSKSIGISQIRFNDEGKINFHQDFWDNTTGFFGHLPLLGSLITKVKASMK